MDRLKSVLDGVPVKDNAFPLQSDDNHVVSVVGGCPACGAPIYGQKTIKKGQAPEVTYSCHCAFNKASFEQQIRCK